MKILVTGNLGYVGPCVTRELRMRYPQAVLVGADLGYFAHCLTNPLSSPDALLDVQHDVDVRCFPPALLAGVDAVVHLAAISNDPMGTAYEDVTFDINYRAAVALADQAKQAGVRSFVFASSCSVYGCADDVPRTEQSPVNPLTAYAKSKVRAETALAPLAGANFRVTCLRFATACGMSDRLRLDLVLNDFVASALTSGTITILSDGTPWRPLINVTDMARAIAWGISRDTGQGGDFLIVNAGSDTWNYQVRELADAVARVVPGTTVSVNPEAPPDKRSYRVDFSLFRSLAPHHQVAADLETTVRDLRRGLQGMLFDVANFRESPLIRLRVLAALQEAGVLSGTLDWVAKSRASTCRRAMSTGEGRAVVA